MSGRPSAQNDLGADHPVDDFLAGIGLGRTDGVRGSQGQKDMGACCRLVRGVRDGRFPRVRRIFTAFARLIPACVLDWFGCQLCDGSIWEPGLPANCGPGDTGALGAQIRNELDEEIGWRVIGAAMPVFVIGEIGRAHV